MKKAAFIAVGLITLFALTGCNSHNHGPIPEDTILGSRYKSGPDWVDDGEVYREEGLSLREGSSDRNLTSYIENARPDTSVYFGFDQSSLTTAERGKLKGIKDRLQSTPNTNVLVVGRCDWHGTQEYNLALGDRRATSVQNYLEDLGVDLDRIKTLSKGSLGARKGVSAEESQGDRRADVILMQG